jgi:hypothetical protein
MNRKSYIIYQGKMAMLKNEKIEKKFWKLPEFSDEIL